MQEILNGSTTNYIYFVAVDSTDYVTRETGLSSFSVYRARNGAAGAAMTTPTVAEVSAGSAPGVYSLLMDEDTTIGAGNQSENMVLHVTQASMAPVTIVVKIVRPDVTAGQTITAANGCADADIERLQGSVIATPTVSGVLEVDVTHWIGTAAATPTVAGVPEVDITHFGGSAGTFAAGRPEVNTTHAAGTAWGSGAITAGSIATGAIDADALAADAVTEIWAGSTAPTAAAIADAVWDEDATAHQTQGTFGQAIGDPVADTNTIYKAVVTDATGATVGVDVVAIKAETASIQTDTNDLQTQIGVAGAGLTAIDLPDQTMNITGNITGNLSGSVGSVTGAVGSVTGNVGGNVTGSVGSVTGLTNASIADQVWDEAIAGHAGAGSTGEALSAAGSAGDPWATALPGAYGAGTAGNIVGNNLDAPVSVVDAVVDAIKVKTDSLTFTVANQVDSNVQYVNDVAVTGDGQLGTEWGPA